MKRDNGIDLLRIVLMFMIVMGHMFTHTNIRTLTEAFSVKWYIIWLIQTITICSVDCFIIISGYYGCESKFHLSKIKTLWGKTIFYSVVITGILLSTKAFKMSGGTLLNAFFPVLRNEYWFITTYILLYIFTPFLNRLLGVLNTVQLKVLGILIVLIFYVEPILSVVFYQVDSLEGFGIIGFITLYLIGAIIRKKEVYLTKKTCILVLTVNAIVMCGSKAVLTFFTQSWHVNFGTALLYHYNTLFVLLNAIALIFLFRGMKLPKQLQRTIIITTPSILAVYLLHEKPALRSILWNDSFTALLLNASLPKFVLITFAVSAIIVTVGIVIDGILERTLFNTIRKTKLYYKLDSLCTRFDQLVNNKEN